MLIRDATQVDIPAIQAIYAHHVLKGTGTFEEDPPGVEEMRRRHDAVVSNGLPWLVADMDGVIAGYAYAQIFHARSGWRFTLEDSVYVATAFTRRGIGKSLLNELTTQCAALGYREMIAVIGDSANLGSINLHASVGFVQAGLLKDTGYKFGQRLDVIYMQKSLV